MTDTNELLYVIPARVETQKGPLDKYCFGSCGKISMGGMIYLVDIGPCWVCTHKDCHHEKGHTGVLGDSGLTGDNVCVRGLTGTN